MTCMQQIFVCMNHEQNAKYRGDINVMNVVVIAMVIAIFQLSLFTTKLVLINYIIHIINYEYYMISTLNRNQNNNIHNNLLSLILSHCYSKTWICPQQMHTGLLHLHCSLRPTWWPKQTSPTPALVPDDLGSRRLWRLWCWYELPETWHHTTMITEMKIYHLNNLI